MQPEVLLTFLKWRSIPHPSITTQVLSTAWKKNLLIRSAKKCDQVPRSSAGVSQCPPFQIQGQENTESEMVLHSQDSQLLPYRMKREPCKSLSIQLRALLTTKRKATSNIRVLSLWLESRRAMSHMGEKKVENILGSGHIMLTRVRVIAPNYRLHRDAHSVLRKDLAFPQSLGLDQTCIRLLN